ncbi:MAG: nucleotidyltransferase domain-containing protein [Candidatus Cloacimonetes bacterium]|nr:nucleotidyltransferase domain-containing protein [Candidatus Cloacimonadota bacterium]
MSKFAEKYTNDAVLHKICRENGVKYLALFGSSARDDSDEDSDLDFFYRLQKGMTYFQFYDLLQKLQAYFGREIDACP